MCKRITLTPALSHRMGEGESPTVSSENPGAGFAGGSFAKWEPAACFSLSLPMGEGQGEGWF